MTCSVTGNALCWHNAHIIPWKDGFWLTCLSHNRLKRGAAVPPLFVFELSGNQALPCLSSGRAGTIFTRLSRPHFLIRVGHIQNSSQVSERSLDTLLERIL